MIIIKCYKNAWNGKNRKISCQGRMTNHQAGKRKGSLRKAGQNPGWLPLKQITTWWHNECLCAMKLSLFGIRFIGWEKRFLPQLHGSVGNGSSNTSSFCNEPSNHYWANQKSSGFPYWNILKHIETIFWFLEWRHLKALLLLITTL